MSVLEDIQQGIITYKPPLVKQACEQAVAQGMGPREIVQEGLIAGMAVVGAKFRRNEVFVPEVMIAARAMHAGLDVVKPLLAHSEIEPVGTVVLGTVKGDLHDIGKNLVAMMLEGAGFRVFDLGIDTPVERFIQAIQENKPQIVGMSSLITNTLPRVGETIEALQQAGLRNQVKVMVGGAPVSQSFADQVGADAYAADASSAVEKAKELLGLA
ncbi:MAG: corrinoid protein [Thermaerobacter sp.]|nr:corrinoid protein [Thermaerobacter sp.]MDA8145963.1 corrinoid protein [Thermaerobacter sp.]